MKVETAAGQLVFRAEEPFVLANAQALQTQLLQGLNAFEGAEVILDLSAIDFIDSTGIKLIVGLFTTCKNKQKSLTLHVATEGVRSILHICQMHKLIPIQEVQPA